DLILQDNITVISTSHDPWWVERCDRIIELENYG
ncbi:MAG TPA: ABC transporter ATP-binding protein, partial [Balneolaceae bacterium]|nr:ABC transporter ATP-binding protein [Balneolaceae bacterium]